MSANPIEENSTPKTTGSLEELFRHHLGEEATVTPRAMLWDQIDNSLLVRQNEIYRRRLAVTRWVAAASLLLATLAGTGWWARRDTNLGGAGGAVMTEQPAQGPKAAATGRSAANAASAQAAATQKLTSTQGLASATGRERSSAENVAAPAPNNAATDGTVASTYPLAARAQAARVAAGYQQSRVGVASVPAKASWARTGEAGSGLAMSTTGGTIKTKEGTSGLANATTKQASRSGAAIATGTAAQTADLADAKATLAATNTAGTNAATDARRAATPNETAGSAAAAAGLHTERIATLASATAGAAPAGVTEAGTASAESVDALGGRSVALALAAAAELPAGVAAVPTEALPVVTSKRWSYGATYAAGLFNPNVNFSRVGIDPEYGYNPALGADSPKLTEEANAEYRKNLRPGFSQRLALLATRHLRGHWSMSTGLAFAQATATSASSSAFVGEQLLDVGQVSKSTMQPTNFRYRLASVPVELRYDNPARKGWSLYGRLGGAVSALLGVRSEVEGNPEATRTYSIASAGTPYRRVSGNLQGGTGVRYRSANGAYALTVGPMAEIGLLSLNARPAQNLAGQSRAYSVGLEAGVEFGR